jgi:hypothetical protein
VSSFGPAWAIVRGYLIYSVAYGYVIYGGIRELPKNGMDTFVLLLMIAVSVWLNLKKYKMLTYAAIALNIAVLVLLVPEFSVNIQNKIADYRYFIQTRNVENSIIDSNGNLFTTACAYDDLGNRLPMSTLTDPAGSTLLRLPKNFDGMSCPPSKN